MGDDLDWSAFREPLRPFARSKQVSDFICTGTRQSISSNKVLL